MLIKNQIYDAVITDYTADGQGVAHIEGCAVFIPNAIAGETCRVRIEKVGKTWAAGKIVELLEKSPHRVNRECPVAKLCGGCDFWHMDYAEESRLKAQRVLHCLNRMGGQNLAQVPILEAPDCKYYRNKAQYPVSSQKGRVFAGFFRAGTHQVVENERCLILPPQMDQVKKIVVDFFNHYRLSAYDEATHKGLLRHIYVRRGAVSGQVLVCLVINGRKLPHAQQLAQQLQAVEGFTTLVLSVNTKPGNSILGEEFITLYGPGYIEDTLCGLQFRLSPRSFYQVNHHQAQRLYAAAIEQAEITKNDLVLDLYCGVGTITLAMARAAGKVIGVEVVEQAVADAKANAQRNGIENAEFFCADAGKAALELEKQGVRPDVVVVDPPRKGLNADTIEALDKMSPRRIVYISCDPATLARDVKLLSERGYALQSAQAADLFPRCAHVESIVCLAQDGFYEMDNDIKVLFGRLQSKYSLKLTSAFEQGFKSDMDYPILRGTSVLGSFELFYGDLDFEFYAENADGEFLSHRHLKSAKEAEQTVVDFMNGKLTIIQLGYPYDIHEMKLHPRPFSMIKSGEKTIELRLFDEKRQKIKAGDKILFTNTQTGEILTMLVVKLHVFSSFAQLYDALPLLQCGYTTEDIGTAHPSDMEQYYSEEDQKKYGVVGIELRTP